VCEMRMVWSFVNKGPLWRMKLRRCGICSRFDGTFGLSRLKWVLRRYEYVDLV
jgi:hypothetical protein